MTCCFMKQDGGAPVERPRNQQPPASREALAFAIVAEHFKGPGSAAADAIDRITVRLAAFSRIAN